MRAISVEVLKERRGSLQFLLNDSVIAFSVSGRRPGVAALTFDDMITHDNSNASRILPHCSASLHFSFIVGLTSVILGVLLGRQFGLWVNLLLGGVFVLAFGVALVAFFASTRPDALVDEAVV